MKINNKLLYWIVNRWRFKNKSFKSKYAEYEASYKGYLNLIPYLCMQSKYIKERLKNEDN